MLFTLVLCHRGGDRIYEMRCPFVAVGPNARFIVLPHWDNMSQAHMIPHPVTLYWHQVDQICFVVLTYCFTFVVIKHIFHWCYVFQMVLLAVFKLLTVQYVCLFVCGISLTSGQLISELFPDCTRSCFSQVVLRRRGGDRIYEMRCLFVAVGPNARFIVLPHWDNMS